MSKLKLEIITPEKKVFSEDVDEVVLPGTEGELGILPDHLPLMTNLKSGSLRINAGGETKLLVVHGGFAQVLEGEVNVLTDDADWATDVDPEEQRRLIQEAERELAELEKVSNEDVDDDPAELHRLALSKARARLFAAEEHSK